MLEVGCWRFPTASAAEPPTSNNQPPTSNVPEAALPAVYPPGALVNAGKRTGSFGECARDVGHKSVCRLWHNGQLGAWEQDAWYDIPASARLP